MFEKIDVNGVNTHPVYAFLRKNSDELWNGEQAKQIPWSWSKFLVDANGKVVKFGYPIESPASFKPLVEQLLNQ